MERIARETGGLDSTARRGPPARVRQDWRAVAVVVRGGLPHLESGGDKTFHKIAIRPKQAGLTVRPSPVTTQDSPIYFAGLRNHRRATGLVTASNKKINFIPHSGSGNSAGLT